MTSPQAPQSVKSSPAQPTTSQKCPSQAAEDWGTLDQMRTELQSQRNLYKYIYISNWWISEINPYIYIYYHNMQWKITFELHMLINLVVDHVAPPSQSTHGFLSLNVPRGRTTAKKVRWAKMTWVRRRGHEASKCFLYMLWMKPLMKK